MKILPFKPKESKDEHFMTVRSEPDWYVWTCPICGRQVRDSKKDDQWKVDRPGNLQIRHRLQCVMPISQTFNIS